MSAALDRMADLYEIARYVGMPGEKVEPFIKVMAMCGYEIVRKNAAPQMPVSASLGSCAQATAMPEDGLGDSSDPRRSNVPAGSDPATSAAAACCHPWRGSDPPPASWWCCGVKVYRDYAAYCDD